MKKEKLDSGKTKKTPKGKSTKKKTVSSPKFQKSKSVIANVKVIGIGGGGGNAVSRMMDGDRPRGVEFCAINTDAQDLDYVSAHKKMYVGRALTKGLGAGMNPEVGKQAMEENRSEVAELLEGTDILFLTAGMGGGTGTGGIPVVAEIAREKGILTIAIVTKPFSFEGTQRMTIAQEGIARLKDKVDSLVVIPNDKIFNLIDKETSVVKAFGHIDEVLKNAVKAITELINMPGIINVDFADIRSILKDAGTTLIGIGTASGQDRGMKAVECAANSPLLEISIDGAKGVLFSIAGSKDLKMAEIHDIAKAVSANLDSNAKVIFGAYYDKSLKEKNLKVTVVATGFNGMFSQRTPSMPTLFVADDYAEKKDLFFGREDKEEKKEKFQKPEGEKKEREGVKATQEFEDFKVETPDPWEMPAFLRKKKK
jgi:cell division protein FtsZ